MGYNPNDPEQVAKARKRAEKTEALKLEVIRNVMSTSAGRKWIYGILERCHMYSTSFIQGSPDGTAFNEGARNQGIQLFLEVESAAPADYIKMVREAKATESE